MPNEEKETRKKRKWCGAERNTTPH